MTTKKQKPNVTEAKAKLAAEREKRQADALRENLKRRRKTAGKVKKDHSL